MASSLGSTTDLVDALVPVAGLGPDASEACHGQSGARADAVLRDQLAGLRKKQAEQDARLNEVFSILKEMNQQSAEIRSLLISTAEALTQQAESVSTQMREQWQETQEKSGVCEQQGGGSVSRQKPEDRRHEKTREVNRCRPC